MKKQLTQYIDAIAEIVQMGNGSATPEQIGHAVRDRLDKLSELLIELIELTEGAGE